MRPLSGETILSNNQSHSSSAQTAASFAGPSDRAPYFRDGSPANLAGAIDQALAWNVDTAAPDRGQRPTGGAIPRGVPLYPPPHHAGGVFGRSAFQPDSRST